VDHKARALIYGAAQGGLRTLRAYSSTFDIIGFVDSDEAKRGRGAFAGLDVLSPEQSLSVDVDFILVASGAVTSVKQFYGQSSSLLSKLVVVPTSIRLGCTARGKVIFWLVLAYLLLPFALLLALWAK
jgi:FlaA1/EpsC-like NDP-sugar epimerase